MRARLICGFGMLAIASCATAPAKRAGAERQQADLPIPAEYRAEIQKVEAIGRQLYLLDKVSAIATDELMKRVPEQGNRRLGGYLPVQEADDDGHPKGSFMVTFFTRDDPPRVAYEVRIKSNAPAEFAAFDPPKAGTDSFVSLVRARQFAIAALPAVRQPMNPVLIPGSANGEKGILVYFLAGTKTPDLVVFGKHFRVLMPEQGSVPTYVMPLSKSILEMPIKSGPNGEKVQGLIVTHLVTDWPLETHVFVSLQWHLPVYVGTKRGVWRVDGDKIALISDRPPKGL